MSKVWCCLVNLKPLKINHLGWILIFIYVFTRFTKMTLSQIWNMIQSSILLLEGRPYMTRYSDGKNILKTHCHAAWLSIHLILRLLIVLSEEQMWSIVTFVSWRGKIEQMLSRSGDAFRGLKRGRSYRNWCTNSILTSMTCQQGDYLRYSLSEF